jgi:hypothetical protein
MAYANRIEGGEPGPPRRRVIILDAPGEKDLRSLVPEAFTRFPDGCWERRTNRFYLVVESFSGPGTWEARKRLMEDLERRGLNPHESSSNSYKCDLFSSEALCRLYGFMERGSLTGQTPEGFPNARIVREWRNCYTEGDHKNSARVAVSRSFDRLAARGLAERRGAAINLTKKGLETAEGLLVNRSDNIISINQ